MPVRVRLELRRGGVTVLAVALVNTGFTSEASDAALPVDLAGRLGLWPRPSGAIVVDLETGGGVVESYIVPRAVEVRVIAGDRASRAVTANALVNPYIGEPLISDYLAEELGIQVLYPHRGLWRFVDDGPEVVRESERPAGLDIP